MAQLGNGAVTGAEFDSVKQVSSANYTVVNGDSEYIQVTTGSSDRTVTLPTPKTAGAQTGDSGTTNSAGGYGNAGQRVRIQKIDSGNGKVNVSGTLNVGNVYVLANQWSQAVLVSDGTRWNLVATVS